MIRNLHASRFLGHILNSYFLYFYLFIYLFIVINLNFYYYYLPIRGRATSSSHSSYHPLSLCIQLYNMVAYMT